MQLGWYDRACPTRLYILPRHRRADLFDASESPAAYARRFFSEIRGLGNAGICRIRGRSYRRTVALRGL